MLTTIGLMLVGAILVPIVALTILYAAVGIFVGWKTIIDNFASARSEIAAAKRRSANVTNIFNQ